MTHENASEKKLKLLNFLVRFRDWFGSGFNCNRRFYNYYLLGLLLSKTERFVRKEELKKGSQSSYIYIFDSLIMMMIDH